MTRERRLKALEDRMSPAPTPEPMRIARPIIAPNGAVVGIIDRTSGDAEVSTPAVSGAVSANRPVAEMEMER